MLASALSSKLAFSTVVASKTTKTTKKTAVVTKVIIFFLCVINPCRRRVVASSRRARIQSLIHYTRKTGWMSDIARRGGGSIDAIGRVEPTPEREPPNETSTRDMIRGIFCSHPFASSGDGVTTRRRVETASVRS